MKFHVKIRQIDYLVTSVEADNWIKASEQAETLAVHIGKGGDGLTRRVARRTAVIQITDETTAFDET